MPRGKKTCPVCQGSGLFTESPEYPCESRPPANGRCLYCDGSGFVPARLNVSPKSASSAQQSAASAGNQEPAPKLDLARRGITPLEFKRPNPDPADPPTSGRLDFNQPTEGDLAQHPDPQDVASAQPAPNFLEMALNPRLNKVLASGKDFLIVTQSEPYYISVFTMIRSQERKQGTWTPEDEDRYIDALQQRISQLESSAPSAHQSA